MSEYVPCHAMSLMFMRGMCATKVWKKRRQRVAGCHVMIMPCRSIIRRQPQEYASRRLATRVFVLRHDSTPDTSPAGFTPIKGDRECASICWPSWQTTLLFTDGRRPAVSCWRKPCRRL